MGVASVAPNAKPMGLIRFTYRRMGFSFLGTQCANMRHGCGFA